MNCPTSSFPAPSWIFEQERSCPLNGMGGRQMEPVSLMRAIVLPTLTRIAQRVQPYAPRSLWSQLFVIWVFFLLFDVSGLFARFVAVLHMVARPRTFVFWTLNVVCCAYWVFPNVAHKSMRWVALCWSPMLPLILIDTIAIVIQNRQFKAAEAAFETLCQALPVDGSIPAGAKQFIWTSNPGESWTALKSTLLAARGLVVVFTPNPAVLARQSDIETRVVNPDGTFTVSTAVRTFNCFLLSTSKHMVLHGNIFFDVNFLHNVLPINDGWDMHVFQKVSVSGRMRVGRALELGVELKKLSMCVDGKYCVHYSPVGDQMIHISPLSVPHTIRVPVIMWLALKEKKKCSVYETQTILSANKWRELGLEPIEKDDAQLVVSAAGVEVEDPSVMRYTLSDFSLGQDELGRDAGHAISGHAVDANGLFPRMGLPNEITSAQTRLLCFQSAEVLSKEVDVVMSQDMFELVNEFLQILPCGLTVEGVEEVSERQKRPGQRRQIDETLQRGFDPHVPTKMVPAMLKLEAYGEVKEPRTVLNDNGPNKLPYSQVCGAIATALKSYPWYGFGRVPIATAERVAYILRGAQYAVETDYSRYDGRILKLSRVACAMALERMFGGSGWLEWVMTLYENSIACTAVSTNGFRYYTGYSRLTGSPETSVMNTLFNAIAVYTALRGCGMSLEETHGFFQLSVVVAGDDGLMGFTAVPDLPRYEAALVLWGLKVKAHLRRRENGDCCSFLARWYSPAWGDTNSCCDLKRQLPRLHLSASSAQGLMSPEEECFAKALAVLTSDSDTPVIGHWARTVVRLYGRDPNRYLPQSDDLHREVDAMVNRVGVRGLMPWQLEVLGMTRGDEWYPNVYEDWMMTIFLVSYEGRVTSDSVHEHMSALSACTTFKDLDLVPSLVPFSMALELPPGVVLTTDGIYGPIPATPLAQAALQVKSPVPQAQLRGSVARGRGRPAAGPTPDRPGRRARAREGARRRASQSSSAPSQ